MCMQHCAATMTGRVFQEVRDALEQNLRTHRTKETNAGRIAIAKPKRTAEWALLKPDHTAENIGLFTTIVLKDAKNTIPTAAQFLLLLKNEREKHQQALAETIKTPNSPSADFRKRNETQVCYVIADILKLV